MGTANAINLNTAGFASFNATTGKFSGLNFTSTDNSFVITNPNGTTAATTDFKANLSNININSLTGGGPLAVNKGGTGATSFPPGGILVGGPNPPANSPLGSIAPGTPGQVLLSTSSTTAPTFGTLALTGGLTSTAGSGTLSIAAPPITFNGSGIAVTGGSPTANQVLLGGTLTLTVAGGGLPWIDVTSSPQPILSNNGYTSDVTTGVTFTLPATPALGDKFYITGNAGTGTGANLWIITISAPQTVWFGTQLGTASLKATNPTDSVYGVCIVPGASAIWNIIASIGNVIVT